MKRASLMFVCLAVVACDDPAERSEVKAEKAAVEPAAMPVPAPEKAEPELAVDDVPTREDFEAEANKEITQENYEQKLDDLEEEIETD